MNEYEVGQAVWVLAGVNRRRAATVTEVLGDDEYKVRYLTGGTMTWDCRWLKARVKDQTMWTKE